jgi:hypothetical protein
MRDECIIAVSKAAAKIGRALKPKDFDNIEQRLNQARKDIAATEGDAFEALTTKEQVTKAAQRVAQDIAADTRRKAENVARAVAAKEQATKFVKGQVAKGEHPVEAVNRMNVTDQDLGANVSALEQERRGIYSFAMRNILAMYNTTKKWAGFWTDKNAVRDVVREINGEDTGNMAARHAAKKWLDASELLRKQYNELGGNIRKLAYGYLPHKWNTYKLSRISADTFANEIVPRLKRTMYRDETGRRLTDEQLTEMVKQIHFNATTDGAFGAGHESSLANRHQDRRVLHFNTADDWLDVNAKYGTGSVLETMLSHGNTMSKEIAAMKVWGPSPDHTFAQVLVEAGQMARKADPQTSEKTDAKMHVATSMYNAAIGRLGPIANMKVHRVAQVIRSINLLKLGGSAVSALSDGSNVTAVARSWSIPYVRRYLFGLKAWLNADFRRQVMSQGYGLEAMNHSIARFGEEAMSTGVTGRFAQTMLKLFLVNFEDTVRRVGSAAMLGSEIERLAAKHETMDTLHPHDNVVITHRGVNATDWAVWRLAGERLNADKISQIPDSAIAHLGNPDTLRRDAAQKLIGVVLSDIDTVVPLMTAKMVGKVDASGFNTKRGTVGGELIRSFLTFKSFPLSNFQNHLDRMAGRPTLGGSAAYAAQVIATSTIMGAITVQLKALANGENPQDMTDLKYWGRAVVQGGALGLYFDILAGALVNLHGDKPKDAATAIVDQMGPTAGTIKDLIEMLSTGAAGNADKAGEKASRIVSGMAPKPFYAKAAIDRMVFQRIIDFFNPGASDRMRERVQNQYHSGFYWPPSESDTMYPPESPNLRTAVGERQ